MSNKNVVNIFLGSLTTVLMFLNVYVECNDRKQERILESAPATRSQAPKKVSNRNQYITVKSSNNSVLSSVLENWISMDGSPI